MLVSQIIPHFVSSNSATHHEHVNEGNFSLVAPNKFHSPLLHFCYLSTLQRYEKILIPPNVFRLEEESTIYYNTVLQVRPCLGWHVSIPMYYAYLVTYAGQFVSYL